MNRRGHAPGDRLNVERVLLSATALDFYLNHGVNVFRAGFNETVSLPHLAASEAGNTFGRSSSVLLAALVLTAWLLSL
jgi:hypothetical protein